MNNPKIISEDLSKKIQVALDRAKKRLVVETKALNTYIVVSDGKGGTKKYMQKIYKSIIINCKNR
jgi:hypothetical protein